jgi:hypothetical protein
MAPSLATTSRVHGSPALLSAPSSSLSGPGTAAGLATAKPWRRTHHHRKRGRGQVKVNGEESARTGSDGGTRQGSMRRTSTWCKAPQASRLLMETAESPVACSFPSPFSDGQCRPPAPASVLLSPPLLLPALPPPPPPPPAGLPPPAVPLPLPAVPLLPPGACVKRVSEGTGGCSGAGFRAYRLGGLLRGARAVGRVVRAPRPVCTAPASAKFVAFLSHFPPCLKKFKEARRSILTGLNHRFSTQV